MAKQIFIKNYAEYQFKIWNISGMFLKKIICQKYWQKNIYNINLKFEIFQLGRKRVWVWQWEISMKIVILKKKFKWQKTSMKKY